MYTCRPLPMDKQRQDDQRLDDQLEPIYNSSVPIKDVDWKTSQERWTIETSGKRVINNSKRLREIVATLRIGLMLLFSFFSILFKFKIIFTFM